jgi:hypothetical protein
MKPRVNASEYTPEEISTMPAEPLLDWLVWQALGWRPIQCQEDSYIWFVLSGPPQTTIDAHWIMGEDAPCIHYSFSASRNWMAAGHILDKLQIAGVDYFLESYHATGIRWCRISVAAGSVFEAHGSSNTHAIARACAMMARIC